MSPKTCSVGEIVMLSYPHPLHACFCLHEARRHLLWKNYALSSLIFQKLAEFARCRNRPSFVRFHDWSSATILTTLKIQKPMGCETQPDNPCYLSFAYSDLALL